MNIYDSNEVLQGSIVDNRLTTKNTHLSDTLHRIEIPCDQSSQFNGRRVIYEGNPGYPQAVKLVLERQFKGWRLDD